MRLKSLRLRLGEIGLLTEPSLLHAAMLDILAVLTHLTELSERRGTGLLGEHALSIGQTACAESELAGELRLEEGLRLGKVRLLRVEASLLRLHERLLEWHARLLGEHGGLSEGVERASHLHLKLLRESASQ